MSDVIVVDIETIPQQTTMTKKQKDLYKRLMANQIKRGSDGVNKLTISELKKIRGLVMSTNPYLGEVIVIGLYRNKDGNEGSIALTGTEKEILERFWATMATFKGTIVSFNGLEFDFPFIIKRSMKHLIKPTNNDVLDMKRFSRYPHFDAKMVLGNWDKYATGNLDLICEFLNISSPKEGGVRASEVEQAYHDGRIVEIAEYCLRDVEATYKVYNIAKDYTYKVPFKN